MAVMNKVMVDMKKVLPSLILNMDSTQFTVTGNNQNQEVVFIKNEDVTTKKKRKAAPPKGLQLTSFFIKFYLLISAEGYMGTPVFVFQDENMSADDFDFHRSENITPGANVHGYSYIVSLRVNVT